MGPCEDHVRLALEFQALLFSVVPEQLARASNATRGLDRFLLCLLPAGRRKQFLRERYTPAVVDDVIVRTALREYRQHTWKNDLELNQTLRPPGLSCHDPILRLLLLGLRLVLVPGMRNNNINSARVRKTTRKNLRTPEVENPGCEHWHYPSHDILRRVIWNDELSCVRALHLHIELQEQFRAVARNEVAGALLQARQRPSTPDGARGAWR